LETGNKLTTETFKMWLAGRLLKILETGFGPDAGLLLMLTFYLICKVRPLYPESVCGAALQPREFSAQVLRLMIS
jgi:hypothetical protein